VKSFVIGPLGGVHTWNTNFEVTFKQIRLPPAVDISNFYKSGPIEDEDSARSISLAENDGYVDLINGAPPSTSGFVVSGLLNVNGWHAKSIGEGATPRSVLVVLTDTDGRSIFLNTRQVPRPDVAAYFGKPVLAASGYKSVVDVSTLDGKYTLGLAFTEGDRIERCSQIKIPVMFKKLEAEGH
jgi:hypothetical protein